MVTKTHITALLYILIAAFKYSQGKLTKVQPSVTTKRATYMKITPMSTDSNWEWSRDPSVTHLLNQSQTRWLGNLKGLSSWTRTLLWIQKTFIKLIKKKTLVCFKASGNREMLIANPQTKQVVHMISSKISLIILTSISWFYSSWFLLEIFHIRW